MFCDRCAVQENPIRWHLQQEREGKDAPGVLKPGRYIQGKGGEQEVRAVSRGWQLNEAVALLASVALFGGRFERFPARSPICRYGTVAADGLADAVLRTVKRCFHGKILDRAVFSRRTRRG